MPVSNLVATASIEEQCRDSLKAGQLGRVLTMLMQTYGRDLHRYCWALLRERAQAEDVLQNVFVQVHQSLPAFEGRSSFKVWLFTIARHRCLDELRRRQRWAKIMDAGPADVEPAADSAETPHDADARALAAALQECLEHLSAENREFVTLRFQHDTAYDDIAAIVGVSAGALRTRVCRSLTELRRCLEHKQDQI